MMRFINFISTPSINHHTRVKQWFVISCGSLTTLFAALSMISAYQLHQWHNLTQITYHQQPFAQTATDLITQHSHLTAEKEALLKKAEDWEKFTHFAKKPSNLLNVLQKNSNQQNTIKTVHMVKRSVQCTMSVQTVKDGMQIARSLSTSTVFQTVAISSIKPEADSRAEVTIEGSLTKA